MVSDTIATRPSDLPQLAMLSVMCGRPFHCDPIHNSGRAESRVFVDLMDTLAGGP